MTEEPKKFDKTTQLTLKQIEENVDSYNVFKMNNIPDNTHLIARIKKAMYKKELKGNYAGKFVFLIDVELVHKELTEPAEFTIQVGETAIKRLTTKYPDDKYVGMNAFFNKTAWQGNHPQNVNPFDGEVNVGDTKAKFKKKEDAKDDKDFGTLPLVKVDDPVTEEETTFAEDVYPDTIGDSAPDKFDFALKMSEAMPRYSLLTNWLKRVNAIYLLKVEKKK